MMRAVLTFRTQVTRTQFWTAGGWLLLAWFVGYMAVALTALAGGVGPAIILLGWMGFTLFALYTWTALLVGRLRHLQASLWWMALWPLTGPVFWIVMGVLPAHPLATADGTHSNVPPVAAILLVACAAMLAIGVLILSTFG